MFAVLKTGGKQYKVKNEDKIVIEKIEGEEGSQVVLGDVVLFGDSNSLDSNDAQVKAEIVKQFRDRKVLAFKKRRRQNSRRIRGHRQHLTEIKILDIGKGLKVDAKTAEKKSAKPTKEETTAKADKSSEVKFKDDVSLISGVGPALVKKLSEAGITSLNQIAKLTSDEAAKLDENLKLGGRIERDEWIEQAKELIAGKPPRAKIDQKNA